MGFVTRHWAIGKKLRRFGQTVAFAFVGVTIGCTVGFGLSLIYHYRIIRAGCAFVRAIHEIFWALIFLQFFGLHPLTGVLAICIPYSGVFAKVYSEILEEAENSQKECLPYGTSVFQALFIRK